MPIATGVTVASTSRITWKSCCDRNIARAVATVAIPTALTTMTGAIPAAQASDRRATSTTTSRPSPPTTRAVSPAMTRVCAVGLFTPWRPSGSRRPTPSRPASVRPDRPRSSRAAGVRAP